MKKFICLFVVFAFFLISSSKYSNANVLLDYPINNDINYSDIIKDSNDINIKNSLKKFDEPSKPLLLNRDDITLEFYKERIPKEFYNAFIYYTKDYTDIRMPFFCIMVHESNNFTSYSHKNENGTWDYGPSHLNQSNVENAYFRKLYSPVDESRITTKYCYYMVMTINFFIDMTNKYGLNNAFMPYNGGEKVFNILKNNDKNHKKSYIYNVKSYDRAINRNIIKYTKILNKYIETKRNEALYELSHNSFTKTSQWNEFKKIGTLVDNKVVCDFRIKYILKFFNEKIIGVRDSEIDLFNV
jgi:hypothetical protein